MPIDSLESLTQFGVAGLMGILWTWERYFSRRRERELTEAHRHLIAQRESLTLLVDLVERNTRAIERFDRTQARIADVLEKLSNKSERQAA